MLQGHAAFLCNLPSYSCCGTIVVYAGAAEVIVLLAWLPMTSSRALARRANEMNRILHAVSAIMPLSHACSIANAVVA